MSQKAKRTEQVKINGAEEVSEAVKVEFSKEELESRELRKQFIKIAGYFLVDGLFEDEIVDLSNEELGEYIQMKFQENLENFFRSSGLESDITKCTNEEDVLNLIATKGIGFGGWVDMLPNLINENPGAGMSCTMRSAMLHIALDRLGFSNSQTVHVVGHHVAIREHEDGSIILYDPSYLYTNEEGVLVGYSQVFKSEQVIQKTETEEMAGRKGFVLVLNCNQQDSRVGFNLDQDSEGKLIKQLYAYDPAIKMDLAVALNNLDEVKDDARELGGAKDLPLLDEADYLSAVADYLGINKLSDEELATVAKENIDKKVPLLEAAKQSVLLKKPAPNPFDYIKSNLLNPKDDAESPPDPNQFISEALERHRQAKALCAKYPELYELNAKKIIQEFKLFNIHDLMD